MTGGLEVERSVGDEHSDSKGEMGWDDSTVEEKTAGETIDVASGEAEGATAGKTMEDVVSGEAEGATAGKTM